MATDLGDGNVILVDRSVQDDGNPPDAKLVRIDVLSGFLLSPSGENDTTMRIFADFDFGGNVPSILFEGFVAETCETMRDLTNFLKSQKGMDILRDLEARFDTISIPSFVSEDQEDPEL